MSKLEAYEHSSRTTAELNGDHLKNLVIIIIIIIAIRSSHLSFPLLLLRTSIHERESARNLQQRKKRRKKIATPFTSELVLKVISDPRTL
jgi:hypothetical protein